MAQATVTWRSSSSRRISSPSRWRRNGGGDPEVLAEAERWLESNVTFVRGHPAVWGYYVCDDCCKGADYPVALAPAYGVVRDADPYHPTTGAFECGEFHSSLCGVMCLDARRGIAIGSRSRTWPWTCRWSRITGRI